MIFDKQSNVRGIEVELHSIMEVDYSSDESTDTRPTHTVAVQPVQCCLEQVVIPVHLNVDLSLC